MPGGKGGGDHVEVAGGQQVRRGEEGAKFLHHADMVADAVGRGAGERGEEGGDGGVGGGEVARLDRVQDEGGFLVGRDGLAHLILGDHGGEGAGGGGWLWAEEGGDGGVAQRPGRR